MKLEEIWTKLTEFVHNQIKYIIVAAVAVVVGLGLAGSYAFVIDYTNSLGFCAHTCHEMEATVYQEYTHSKHFRNEQGVVVACAQCHVPQNNWTGTFEHKFFAAFELWNHFVLGESNPAKFETRRHELAKKVWAEFKDTNARQCKACHKYTNMILEDQRPSIRSQHTDAMKTDENCLDCHKGITHKSMEEAAPASAKGAGGGFDVQ